MVHAIQIEKKITMNKVLKIAVWPIILAPVVYLAIIWSSLPEEVAVHFDLQGNANRYGSKNEIWLFLAIMSFISIVLTLFIPKIYKKDSKNAERLQILSFVITIFLSFVACVVINSASHGAIRPDIKFVFGSIGFLWCIIGNYIYNIKPNYFIGIRLPWTLINEENWKKTNRFGGKLLFTGGLLILLAAFILPKNTFIFTFLAITILTISMVTAYSYNIYRKQKQLLKK
jgi:uncharacterized membrane protein